MAQSEESKTERRVTSKQKITKKSQREEFVLASLIKGLNCRVQTFTMRAIIF